MYDQECLVQFLSRMIEARSLSGEEGQLIGIFVKELRQLHFDDIWIDANGSAVGIVQGKLPGPTVLFDAHCDTVGAVATDWSSDPFSAVIKGERIFGRGAADTKGNLAAMVYAAAAINREQLHGRVAICASVSEEVVEGGSLKSVMKTLQPDFVIIGEATELRLNRGGRGRAEILLTTSGRPAHSSSPQAGHCAVTDMFKVISRLSQRQAPVNPILGPASMVLTDIISAPYPAHSVIPYRCQVTYDRRLLTGESEENVISEIRQLCEPADVVLKVDIVAGEDRTYTGASLQCQKFFPAWLIEEDHYLVKRALSGLAEADLHPEVGAYRFCTNAAYSAGIAGVPTIGYGLGREEDAHTIDESIELVDLFRAANGYMGIIQGLC
jgi:putative selenium metabolism hydrolase